MKTFKETLKEDLNTMGVGVTTSNSPEDGNIGAHKRSFINYKPAPKMR